MKILYFGDTKNKKIVLVHGFQAPYHMWKEYIDYFKEKYCVIVPILPGHYKGSENFINFEIAVSDFEKEYIKKFGKDIYAVYAISMGGIFATKLFSRRNLNIQKFILESVPLLRFGKIIAFFAKKQYITISRKICERKSKYFYKLKNAIKNKSLFNEFLNVLDNMSETSIKNYIDDMLNYKFPKDIYCKDLEIYYYYGGDKEEIPFKISAMYLKKYYPQTKTFCIEGKKHCEGVISEPYEKIKLLESILNN